MRGVELRARPVEDDGDLVRDQRKAPGEALTGALEQLEDADDVVTVDRVVPRREVRRLGLLPGAQTSDGMLAPSQMAWMAAEAPANSSSLSTGVPSNGRSRVISSHERQPPNSSRTLTVTGRGMR